MNINYYHNNYMMHKRQCHITKIIIHDGLMVEEPREIKWLIKEFYGSLHTEENPFRPFLIGDLDDLLLIACETNSLDYSIKDEEVKNAIQS